MTRGQGEAARSRGLAASLVDEWRARRAELRAIEMAGHPPIVDHYGREWTWVDGDLYRHDGIMAWPRTFIEDERHGLPSADLARNPNYAGLCAICRQYWPRRRKVVLRW